MPALRRLSKVCIDVGVLTPRPSSRAMCRREIEYKPLNFSLSKLFAMSRRCPGGLQWDNLCIWTDFIWKNTHHGGKDD